MPSLRAVTERPCTWSWCSWVTRIASRVSGSSFTDFIRLKSSRQESPASKRMRVLELETMVLLPLEPLASTVILTMFFRILPTGVEETGQIRGRNLGWNMSPELICIFYGKAPSTPRRAPFDPENGWTESHSGLLLADDGAVSLVSPLF